MTDLWSRRLARALLFLVTLTAIGTLGYMKLEGWSAGDALYMSILILSTVGLETPHPLSAAGRAFTIGLIVTGVTIAAYLVSSLGEYVAAGVLTGLFRRRRMQRAIGRLSGHYIVCGYGRVGHQIAADIRLRGQSVVIIESAQSGNTNSDDTLAVTGDATEDEILLEAGVRRARGLVAATGTDSTNLVIALSARALNPDLLIVARASDPATESKLQRAGATHVISPYAIGGHRIVSELLSPGITAFLDSVGHAEHLDLWLEVVTVVAEGTLVGRTLADAIVPSKGALNLVAFRRGPEGAFVTNPLDSQSLVAGDTVVAIGPQAAVRHLGTLAVGRDDRRPASARPRAPGPTRIR